MPKMKTHRGAAKRVKLLLKVNLRDLKLLLAIS